MEAQASTRHVPLSDRKVADIKKSYQWLEKAELKDSTEALIMLVKEEALSTRSIEAGVYHSRQDPR